MDGSTSSAKEERLERLLKEQKLKQQHVEESDPDPIDEQSEDVETYVSMSSPNRPGMATIIASSLCFLALLIIVAILVIKQYKDSDFCKKQNVKKE